MYPSIKVLFICLGNICRSPLAEGVMYSYLSKNGLLEKFILDSAGTSDYHAGFTPDKRSVAVANKYGIQLNHKARKFTINDFSTFDYILVMDHINYEDVLSLAKNQSDYQKVFLLRSFDDRATEDFNIPDPYYGFDADFEEVYDICKHSVVGFINFLKSQNILSISN